MSASRSGGPRPVTEAEQLDGGERERLLRSAERGLLLTHWAQDHPDRTAIVSPAGNRTFAELDANANRVVRALRARGLQAGDSVALMCTNRPEFVEVWAGCLRGGLRITPVNWHLTGEEAGYIVDDCEAKAVVAASSLADAAEVAVAAAPRAEVRIAIGGEIEGWESYEAAVAAESGDALDDASLGATMLYTSGTTGRPKGVHRQTVAAQSAAAGRLYGYREDDAHLCTGPMYHAAPLAFSIAVPLSAGVTVVVMERWDPAEALRLVQEHGITHTHMVPTMFHRLLQLPDAVRAAHDVSSLRHILHGAAPCPVHVKQALIEWVGPVVYEYYAATEGLGTSVDSETWLTKPGTVGKPVPDDQVLVGDERAERLPPGEVGIVWLKAPAGPGRFEYYKDGAKTESAYEGDYFTLGDMGYVDEDGYLFLTDRSADLIITGGVNVYPAEVDAVLLEHPAVADAAVIGIPDDDWGETVLAVVEPKPDAEAGDALATDLIEWCRGHLAHFKCPRRVDFVDVLTRGDNGKVARHRLRAKYRAAGA
ncbi:MAG: AMP-binding protein [Acidimicrobiia bacterium]|nr:AMP-binding protein [Acidimicrobiia bacterium]